MWGTPANSLNQQNCEGQALDEIAKSEAELRTIIDAIPQLIIAIETGGNFLCESAVLEL
jgi:hypothetical protein